MTFKAREWYRRFIAPESFANKVRFWFLVAISAPLILVLWYVERVDTAHEEAERENWHREGQDG